jgi:hypothetical protein
VVRLPAHVERRHLAAAAFGCVALGVVAVVDPSETTLTPPCPLRALTGLDCPLCGATRATHALVRGDVLTALDFNALYVAALPVVLVVGLLWLMRGRLPDVTRRARTAWVLLSVGVAFAVLRNVPIEPVSILSSAVARQ